MSLRREEGETSADRVRKLRKSLPPDPALKKPKLTYASQDYFAKLVGAPEGAQGRQRVIAWERDGAEPELRYRERMAELSGGVYTPDDFATTRSTRASLEARVTELERAVAEGDRKRAALASSLRGLQATVDALLGAAEPAAALGQATPAPARKAASTRRGARTQ